MLLMQETVCIKNYILRQIKHFEQWGTNLVGSIIDRFCILNVNSYTPNSYISTNSLGFLVTFISK